MGAHLSCMYFSCSPAHPKHQQCATSGAVVKLVLACNGRTYELSEPVKVAELMLEFPNHFVTEFEHANSCLRPSDHADGHGVLGLSKRVSPLPADHDVKLHHVYLLLPMHRLNTRLSSDELQLISTALAAAASGPISLVDGDVATSNCGCTGITATSVKAPHNTSKVTPLSAQQFHEAASMSLAMGAQYGSSLISMAKSCSVPILELLGDDGDDENKMDHSETQKYTALQLQNVHIMRSRSWTPKLETILESSHLFL